MAGNAKSNPHGSCFGAADSWSGARILRPASEYCPKSRTVAIASKETGIHIPFSSAYCKSDMNILDPKGRAFGRDSFNSADMESARVDPDLTA